MRLTIWAPTQEGKDKSKHMNHAKWGWQKSKDYLHSKVPKERRSTYNVSHGAFEHQYS